MHALFEGAQSSFEQRAMEWFLTMDSDFGFSPDAHTYAIWLHHYLHSSQVEKAKQLILQMELKGIDLNKIFLDPYFSDSGERKILEILLKDMGKTVRPVADAGDDALLMSALQDSKTEPAGIVGQSEFSDKEYQEISLLKSSALRSTEASGVAILRKTIDGIHSIGSMEKYNQQLWIEQRSYSAAIEHWETAQKHMPEQVRQTSKLPKNMLSKWHQDLVKEIETAINESDATQSDDDDSTRSFMKLLSPEQLSKITIAEFLRAPSKRAQESDSPISPSYTNNLGKVSAISMARMIGGSVQREHNLQQISQPKNRRDLNLQKGVHQLHSSGKLFNMTLRRVLTQYTKNHEKSSAPWTPFWGTNVVVKVGSILIGLFLKIATISVENQDPMNSRKMIAQQIQAVKHGLEINNGKRYGILTYDPAMFEIIAANPINVAPWCLPMVVPPLPWITWTSGGYLQYRTDAVRMNYNSEHRDFLKAADEANHLTFCHRALDVLGSTAWLVNFKVYKVASHYWNAGISVPGIPTHQELPPVAIPKDMETNPKSARDYKSQVGIRERLMRNSFSSRCDVNYKLDIARAFLGETMYFPHNVDFRGRAYPIPPHLNHMGNDLCRGLLKFKEKKALGSRGLQWLKIQVSNLAGFDK